MDWAQNTYPVVVLKDRVRGNTNKHPPITINIKAQVPQESHQQHQQEVLAPFDNNKLALMNNMQMITASTTQMPAQQQSYTMLPKQIIATHTTHANE